MDMRSIFLLYFLSFFTASIAFAQPFYDSHSLFTTAPAYALTSDALGSPQMAPSQPAEKSKGRAFFYSLLLPGLGERYAGAKGKAEIFMGAELTLWLGYFGFLTYGDWRTEDYQNYAAAHAGVDPHGKPYNFFVNIGIYDNIDEYNAAKLRERNLPQYYRDTATYYWQWDNPAHRRRFEQLRKSAARADNRATLMLGAVFANHLISAIDAVWTVHKHNRGQMSSVDWHLQFGDGYQHPQIVLSLQKRF